MGPSKPWALLSRDMVHIQVINPLQKLRQLSRMFRLSKHIVLASMEERSPGLHQAREERCYSDTTIQDQVVYKPDELSHPTIRCDPEYYKHGDEGGFCVFLVENTLFRVHRCYLIREPSVFADMFRMPQPLETLDGRSDENAIYLSDTAAQFRDLLWALYAPPSQLSLYSKNCDPLPLERLLNVVELSLKYCVTSYEEWAIERIDQLVQGPSSILREASPVICARILNVAILSRRQALSQLVEHQIISRILWSGQVDLVAIQRVAEHHGLRRLRGVVYYKTLINLAGRPAREGGVHGDVKEPPTYPESALTPEPKLREASRAYHSLAAMHSGLSKDVPRLDGHGCASHDECLQAWTKTWEEAVEQCEAEEWENRGTVENIDVLGRLKEILIRLRRALPGIDEMSVTCTLTALEAIGTVMDKVLDELMDTLGCVD